MVPGVLSRLPHLRGRIQEHFCWLVLPNPPPEYWFKPIIFHLLGLEQVQISLKKKKKIWPSESWIKPGLFLFFSFLFVLFVCCYFTRKKGSNRCWIGIHGWVNSKSRKGFQSSSQSALLCQYKVYPCDGHFYVFFGDISIQLLRPFLNYLLFALRL